MEEAPKKQRRRRRRKAGGTTAAAGTAVPAVTAGGLGGVVPKEVRHVLRSLEAAGYEAWCVGGCVRDTLLGRVPQDWDVATSALPEDVMAVFPRRTIPIGLKHGTVMVLSGQSGVEITTFRCDGDYEDHRHPASVSFARSLEEDLRRRDFTINAMAFNLEGDLRDMFRGREDLKRRTIRCVGEPDRRFTEDALRILRGLRFSATLDFEIEAETAAGIHRNRDLLPAVAMERIQMEFLKLLGGPGAARILREFSDVAGVFWPELLEMQGFQQHNVHHCYDVWEHTLHAMEAAPNDSVLRCALLLHDIGKPRTFTMDERGTGHFPGHGAVSREMADGMLRRLKCARVFRERVTRLVEWHDREIPETEKGIRRALGKLGAEDLKLLLALKRADNLAQAPEYRFRQQDIDQAEAVLEEILLRKDCFTLKQLKVNGRDMLNLGFTGPAVGSALEALFDSVVDGGLPNEHRALIRAARRMAERRAPES